MLILSHVCAEFRDKNGNIIVSINKEDVNIFKEVPDSIKEDILFKLLISDGSLEAPLEDKKEQLKRENDPTAGIDAEGKKVVEEVAKGAADANPEEAEEQKTESKAKAGKAKASK